MYGLALASYIISLLGFGSQKLIAVLALTFVYILNVLGIDKMAKAQNLIVILLSVALGLFAAFGLNTDPAKLPGPGFYAKRMAGLVPSRGTDDQCSSRCFHDHGSFRRS